MAFSKRIVHDLDPRNTLVGVLVDWLRAYKDRTERWSTPDSATPAPQLETISRQLQQLTTLFADADLPFVKQRLEIIHEIISDLASADPEKIKEVAASVKAAREKLQTSLDKQQKGD